MVSAAAGKDAPSSLGETAPLTLGNGAAHGDGFTGKYAHGTLPAGRRAAGSSGLTSEIREDVMSQGSVQAPARGAQIRTAIWGSCLLAVACLLTYWLTTEVLTLAYSAPRADDELGGLWAVLATVFVVRQSYEQSLAAALSRMSATLVSFALCLVYLVFLPFHPWALALLIGLSVITVTLIGRPQDATTAAITTAVVMIVAEVSPHDAWRQPILRLADTVIGVIVGLAAAWIGLRAIRHRAPGARRDEQPVIRKPSG
jgi:hypothetical protein